MGIKNFDRYLPIRIKTDVASFNLQHNIHSLFGVESEDETEISFVPIFVNTARKANNILNYRKRILMALNITHSNVLGFTYNKTDCPNSSMYNMPSWPVRSRKMPLIRAPETILDMPDIDTVNPTSYNHLIDWGKQGKIATIFHGEVHLWSCDNGEVAQTQTGESVSNCLKWNRSGIRIAASRNYSKISIIDGETLKELRTTQCKCVSCTITAIEWTKENYVITGCSNGSITILSLYSKPIQHFYQLVKGEIISLKLSCKDTYLLVDTLSTKRKKTYIFRWPLNWNNLETSLMTYFVSKSSFDWIKSMAWHPWKESLLAVGRVDSSVAIWNVNNQRPTQYQEVHPYFKNYDNCILDCISFNPLSAELVMSFSDFDNSYECNFLTVFSDLQTRVDEVRYHIGSVSHVLWDGTGTKLATVGADENLAIWNFFGSNRSKLSKIVEIKEQRHLGSFRPASFGACIR